MEKEDDAMKLALLFIVAALFVACLKGITRRSNDESVNQFHRLGR